MGRSKWLPIVKSPSGARLTVMRLGGSVWRSARDPSLVAPGQRILAIHDRNAHQEVPHFHIHIFGGKDLGRMIKPADK